MVDLPEPDSPVNHSTTGLCPFSFSRSARLTMAACRWMFDARLRPKLIMPAPTVALV